jgi:predicted dehydrogenase
MNKGNLSRRGFLARSLAGLTAGAGLPLWYAREILGQEQARQSQDNRPVAANDNILMGAIGTGTNHTRRGPGQAIHGERGVQIMRDALGQRGVRYVAVCDVDRTSKEFAANIAGRDCAQFDDYRQLLARRDINAVTIGTPDHWHAQIAIAALRAGKDVYCEKPLTLTIEEGKAMVRAVRETNKILQVGSQQRSDARFRLACELVRNGRIGRVRTVETRIGDNPRGGPFAVAPVPEGLNWDFWQGQTPRVDYIPQRCFYEFRWWYEYSGGKMTDWGAHHNDIAQWALGMDNSGPVLIEGRGDEPPRDGRSYNCHPRFTATFTYANGPNGANGTVLRCTHTENGVHFEGENGRWIFVSRSEIRASDGDHRTSRLLNDPLPANATRLEVSNNHMGNFIQCVRSRRQPICNVNVGHRSVTVCHLGNIAIRSGLRLHWDPEQERFVGENSELANRWLSRERRAPWAEEWRRVTTNA